MTNVDFYAIFKITHFEIFEIHNIRAKIVVCILFYLKKIVQTE